MSINLYKFYAGCLYISHVLTRFPTDTLCIIIVLLLVHSMFNCCVVLLYCEDYNWAVSKKTKQKTNQEIYLYILHMMLKWIFNVFERRVLKIKVLFMLNVCRCVLWHASVDTFHFFCVSMLQKPAYAYQLPSFFFRTSPKSIQYFPLFLWLFETFLVTEMCSWVWSNCIPILILCEEFFFCKLSRSIDLPRQSRQQRKGGLGAFLSFNHQTQKVLSLCLYVPL